MRRRLVQVFAAVGALWAIWTAYELVVPEPTDVLPDRLSDPDSTPLLSVLAANLGEPALEGNRIVPLSNGDEIFPAMLESIRGARESISFLTYIYWTGQIARDFASEIEAACRRGERALYLAFEESPAQIMRNMRSIGIDLAPWVKKGLLEFRAERPSATGLEAHLARIQKEVDRFKPRVVIVDPLNIFVGTSSANEVKAMLIRIVDFLKTAGITGLFTSLTSGADADAADALDVARAAAAMKSASDPAKYETSRAPAAAKMLRAIA